MRVSGYKMVDRIKGLDFEHATFVLKQQARLHAASWAYKQKHGLPRLSDKYPQIAERMYFNDELNKQFKSIMDGVCQSGLGIIKDNLGGDHPAYVNMKKIIDADTMTFIRLCFGINGVDEDLMEGYYRVKTTKDENYVKGWCLSVLNLEKCY